MRKLTSLLIVFLALCSVTTLQAQKYELVSPDSMTAVTVELSGDDIYYTVARGDVVLTEKSAASLILSDGRKLGGAAKVSSVKKNSARETIESPFYRYSSFDSQFNELRIDFKGNYGITFRAFDQGVAYCFHTAIKDRIDIADEAAVFNFPEQAHVWLSHTTNKDDNFAMAFQNTYEVTPVSQADQLPAFLPATIDYGHGLKLTILESDLESYPGMFLQAQQGKPSLKGIFARLPEEMSKSHWRAQEHVDTRQDIIASVDGTRNYPWRVLAITTDDRQMPVNNLVYALASACRIGDTEWIKPGKAAWEWWNDWGITGVDFAAGINMETYRYFIDFAAEYGIEYVILDEGWSDPAAGDIMKPIDAIDLPSLVEYGNSKGVGLMLWCVFNVLDDKLEEACEFYSSMGIKGFKVDFLDRDDQQAVEMVYRIADAAARHRLMLDYHGIYKPTGLNRTYPNVVNFEAVFGMEEAKWSTVEKDMPLYDVTFPYIRMMAGPVDFTPGAMRNAVKRDFRPIYNNPMSQGTRCHQLATYIVYDSPLTMLCDAPTLYMKEPDYTKFLVSLPMEYDHTEIVSGVMGESIVTARRNGDNWYVGGLTNWDARTIELKFDFLPAGEIYRVVLYCDGTNASRNGTDYKVREMLVGPGSKLNIEMAPSGGFAMSLVKTASSGRVGPVPGWLDVDPFYKKYLDADGIPVITSENVNDRALEVTATVISQMLSKIPQVKEAMVAVGCRYMIVAQTEEVCVIPEYAWFCTDEMRDFWNKRARGFGGSPEHDFSASCGEENVLGLPGDKYLGESIMVHEFAHLIHLLGIASVEPDFNDRLEAFYQKAKNSGLWEHTYAMENKEEYFTETVQSFFDCNRYAPAPDGVHNSINTKAQLKEYDPEMYAFLCDYFDENIVLDLCNENRGKY